MTRTYVASIALGLAACQVILGDLVPADRRAVDAGGADASALADVDASLDPGDAAGDAPISITVRAEGVTSTFNGGRPVMLDAMYEASSVTASKDGSLVYVGGRAGRSVDFRQPSSFAIAAIQSSSGGPLSTFGQSGIVRLDRAENNLDRLEDVTLDFEGRVLAGGSIGAIDEAAFGGLARVHDDGGLDTTFGDGGFVRFGTNVERAAEVRAMAVRPDGRIMVAGRLLTESNGEWEVLITRLLANGAKDTTWPGYKRDFGFHDGAYDLAFEPTTARTLLVGEHKEDTKAGFDAFTIRLQGDGGLDDTWQPSGSRELRFPPGDDFAYAAARRADGRVYVVGSFTAEKGGIITRLNDDGSPDTTFGALVASSTEHGVVLGNLLRAVDVDAAGRAVVAGWRQTDGGSIEGIVARFAENGTLDGTFGANGIRTINCDEGDVRMRAIVVLADGGIVAVGDATSEGRVYRAFVVRY